MNNQSDIHPIVFFIACIINLIEFTCYIINQVAQRPGLEIAGHHQTNSNIVSRDQTTTTATAPNQTTTPATQSTATDHVPTKPHTNPLFTTLQSLTVKQLQATTGIKSSRYRKSDLIALAAAY